MTSPAGPGRTPRAPRVSRGRRGRLGILLGLVAVAACATPRGEAPAASWPLPCVVFPPAGDPLEACARRDDDGTIRLRPGVLPREGDATAVAAVLVEGELLFALASGRTAPALWFDNGPDPFVEGLARTVRGGRIGFVDESLDPVVPAVWDFAFPFENGLARVCSGCVVRREEGGEHGEVMGGRWGRIDREGRIVTPVEHPRDELPPPP